MTALVKKLNKAGSLPVLAGFLLVALLASTFGVILQALGLGVLLALVAIPFGTWMVAPYFGLLCGICVPLNENSLEVAGINIFGADGLIFLLGCLVVLTVARSRPTAAWTQCPLGEHRIMKWHIAYLGWGLLALAIGLAQYPVADAFGAYRRFYFYSAALPLILLMPLTQRHLRILPLAIWVAFTVVALTGAYRYLTGQTYHEFYFVINPLDPSPRLLSYTECNTVAMALAYSVALLRAKQGGWLKQFAAFSAGTVAVGLLLVSGWRLAFGYGLIIPLGASLFHTWTRGERMWGIVKAVMTVAVVVAAGLTMLTVVFPELTGDAVEQTVDRLENLGIETDSRYYAWSTAFRDLASSPITGVGLGHQMEYVKRSSGGHMIIMDSTTHNTIITVLYQSGIPGLFLLGALHFAILLRVARLSRQMGSPHRPLLVALMLFYVASMGFALFQPLQTGNIVSLYLALGMALVLLRQTHDASKAETAT